jgi:hypothetical protein
VAEAGFARLGARLREAIAEAGDSPGERLKAAARAYVGFARDDRDSFRLMFGNTVPRRHRSGRTADGLASFAFSSPEAFSAFQQLHGLVAHCQQRGLLEGAETLVVVNALWALVHGMAQLLIDEQLKLACAVPEFVDQSLELLLGSRAAGGGRPTASA